MVVDDEGGNGARKDATNLSKVPESGCVNIDFVEDKHREHQEVDEVHTEILNPGGFDGQRGQMRGFQGHQDQSGRASIPDHMMIGYTGGMMCCLQIAKNESKLHDHRGDEKDVSPFIIERVGNHECHEDNHGAHQEYHSLGLFVK